MTITDLAAALEARGIGLNAAGRLTEWDNCHLIGAFPTLRQAVRKLSIRHLGLTNLRVTPDEGT
jgi:hypothetical protein